MRWIGESWARLLLWRGLDGVHVEGQERAAEVLRAGPAVLAANHVSFWDALLVVELSRRLGADCHVLVDAERLRQLPFFRAMGAIALDRGSPLAARGGLRAAVAALAGPGDAVWIFPQGRYRPPHLRPLGLQPGAMWVARRAGVPVVPVALSYPFREGARPAAFVRFGEPVPPDPEALEAALVDGLEALDARADRECATLGPVRPGPATAALARIYRALGGSDG